MYVVHVNKWALSYVMIVGEMNFDSFPVTTCSHATTLLFLWNCTILQTNLILAQYRSFRIRATRNGATRNGANLRHPLI